MNIITVKREDADYWESLLKEESLDLDGRGFKKNAVLANWHTEFLDGMTAFLKVVSRNNQVVCYMEWYEKNDILPIRTVVPDSYHLPGLWEYSEYDHGHDVKVIVAGVDPGEPEARQDNPLLTFEEGKRLAESGEAKPDYAGDILFDKKYGVYPLQITNDGVLVSNRTKLLDKWDFCMGVLCGLGYGELSSSVFFSDAQDTFSVTIRIAKKATECAGLEHPIGRDYCRESLLNARALCTSLNRVWDALKKDAPPRLKGTVIGTLLTMRQPTDNKEGLVKLFDADWNVFIFEIHRGALLRLDEKGHAMSFGVDALFMPAPLSGIPEN